MDYRNSDQIVLQILDQAELLTSNFAIFGNVTIPAGEYRYRSLLGQYLLSTQHTLSGTVTYQQGRFYDGHKKRWRSRPDGSKPPGISRSNPACR